MVRVRHLIPLALALSACSLPFNFEIDVLKYLNENDREASFDVSQVANPISLGPFTVNWPSVPGLTLTAASLNFKVCFTSQTPGATFSGTLDFATYLGKEETDLFDEANLVVRRSVDLAGLNDGGEECVEGQVNLSEAQLSAIQSGTFHFGASISGNNVQSDQEATIRSRLDVLKIGVSGSVRP